MKRRLYATLLASVAALLPAAASAQTPSQAAFVGVAPNHGQIGLLVTGRLITSNELTADLLRSACAPTSFAVARQGAWLVFIPGAPSPVNAAFPAALPELTPFFVRCEASGMAPAPSPASSPAPAVPTPHADVTPGRSFDDRAGSGDRPSIHAMYVLPADGVDERLDVNGAIARSVSSIQAWLKEQSGGSQLQWDLHQGQLDVTFVRLRRTDAQVAAHGVYVRDVIEYELRAMSLVAPGKLYAVYYDGSSNVSCGGGAWPPSLKGSVAAEYLKGRPPGATPCSSNPVGASSTVPGYIDMAVLHEIMHTLGLVASCAPSHHRAGHVSDFTDDLMWAGDAPWKFPLRLDVGRNDYFRHDGSPCPDLAGSGFLDPLPDNYWVPVAASDSYYEQWAPR